MKNWKHLTLEQRKVIANGISHQYKVKEIDETLGYDPTSISKEVKRNRESITIGKNITNCKKTNRWPYVCTVIFIYFFSFLATKKLRFHNSF